MQVERLTSLCNNVNKAITCTLPLTDIRVPSACT